MSEQQIHKWKKWIDQIRQLEETQASDTMTNKVQFDGKQTSWQKSDIDDIGQGTHDSEASEFGDDTNQIQQPVEPDAQETLKQTAPVENGEVAQGTRNFMRLHKVIQQMRSKPTQDNQRTNATNIDHSQTAVNVRPEAAYEAVGDGIANKRPNAPWKPPAAGPKKVMSTAPKKDGIGSSQRTNAKIQDPTNEQHIGFKKLQHKIEDEGKSKQAAGAIAASIGRKKYGAKEFNKMAHQSKLNEMQFNGALPVADNPPNIDGGGKGGAFNTAQPDFLGTPTAQKPLNLLARIANAMTKAKINLVTYN